VPIPLIKVDTHPATAQRVSEVGAALADMARQLTPVVQKACEDMGRSFARIQARRPA